MNKKIIVALILICFCFCMIPAFAANNAASEKNVPQPAKPYNVKFSVLKLEFDDYLGKEIYVKCRIIPWAQDKSIVYQGGDLYILESYIKDFKPKIDDEVLLKVKVCKRDYVDYLQLIEGKIITPALAMVTKKGKITVVESAPHHILTLVVSPSEKYEIQGDLIEKLKECVGLNVVVEGKIRETSYGVFNKSLIVVKYEVLK